MSFNGLVQVQRQLPQQYLDTSSPYYLIIQSFHSLPHLNMWFELSNSTFDPNSSDYLETILFWAVVPILMLIFILLILIIYACGLVIISNSRSVVKLSSSDSSYYKKHSRLCTYRFVITVFVAILGISVGFIVFGSEKFHESYYHLTGNIRNLSNYFGSVGNQASFAKESIFKQINTTLVRFESDLRKRLEENHNSNAVKLANEVMKELTNVKQSLNESYNALEPLNQLEHERLSYIYLLKQINEAEQTRWAIMIGVVTINTLLIALLIIGLLRNSKGSLCFFAFAGVLSLILIWILNALYLGVTVFIADYCTSPDQYTLTVAEKNQIKNLTQKSDGAARSSSTKYTPFKQDLNRVYAKLRTALTQYNDNLEQMSKPLLSNDQIQSYHFPEAILAIENVIDKIVSMLKCDQTSENYRAAVNTLCTNSMLGLAIIVVASVLFGLIMPILICIIPQMWRRMHKKDAYEYHTHHYQSSTAAAESTGNHIDETHPFISLNNVPMTTTTTTTSGAAAANRTNATRHFNESPNFQRMTVAQSSTNSNHHANTNLAGSHHHTNTNSLSRNRYNQPIGSANNNRMNANGYAQTLKMNARLNEYVMAHDPYLLSRTPTTNNAMMNNLKNYTHNQTTSMKTNTPNCAFPSAPPASQTSLPPPPPLNACGGNMAAANYLLHHSSNTSQTNGSEFSNYAAGHANSINSRTLLGHGHGHATRKYDVNGSNGAYGTLSRNY